MGSMVAQWVPCSLRGKLSGSILSLLGTWGRPLICWLIRFPSLVIQVLQSNNLLVLQALYMHLIKKNYTVQKIIAVQNIGKILVKQRICKILAVNLEKAAGT